MKYSLFFILAFIVLISSASAVDWTYNTKNTSINISIINNNINNITIQNSDHNNLTSLQGGSSGEYFHLNSSIYNYLISNIYDFITSGMSNPFDQVLNTTSNVQFNNVTANNFLGNLNWSYLQNVPTNVINAITTWLIPNTSNGFLYNDSMQIHFNDTKLANDYYNKSEVYNKTETYNQTEIQALIPSNLRYYFWNVSAPGYPDGYKIMNTTDPTGLVLSITNISGLTDAQILATRVNPNTNLTRMSAGILTGHTHLIKISGTKDLQVYGEVYLRQTNGTETLHATTTYSNILSNGILNEIGITTSMPELIINSSDVLVWKLRARVTGSGTDPSISIQIEDDTHAGISFPVSSTDLIITETDPVVQGRNNNFTGNNNFAGNITIADSKNIIYNSTTMGAVSYWNGTCQITKNYISGSEWRIC